MAPRHAEYCSVCHQLRSSKHPALKRLKKQPAILLNLKKVEEAAATDSAISGVAMSPHYLRTKLDKPQKLAVDSLLV